MIYNIEEEKKKVNKFYERLYEASKKVGFETKFGHLRGQYEDVEFEIHFNYLDNTFVVALDMEDWEQIYGDEYMKMINDAYAHAKQIGQKIIDKLNEV